MGLFNSFEDKDLDSELLDYGLDNEIDNIYQDMLGGCDDVFSGIFQPSVGEVTGKFIDDLWLGATGTMSNILMGIGLPGGFGHASQMKNLMDESGELYNYKVPLDHQYMKCKEVNGLSVWDTKGWWRCLFPESYIKQNFKTKDICNILTKEKVENDTTHKHGLYFSDYSGYMNWKQHMIQVINNKKHKELLSTPPEDLVVLDEKSCDEKLVVGSSTRITYNMCEKGREEVKETKKYFDDGTVSFRLEKKLTPNDGGEPQVETVEKLLDGNSNKSRDGWFWRNQ